MPSKDTARINWMRSVLDFTMCVSEDDTTVKWCERTPYGDDAPVEIFAVMGATPRHAMDAAMKMSKSRHKEHKHVQDNLKKRFSSGA